MTALSTRDTTSPQAPNLLVIVGPTAVGKSRLALELAADLQAEIISADSRQVYRYMDIGTAKPTLQERARARHHMLDLVEPDESYSAGRFAQEGRKVLRRLAAAGTRAIVVGGTGFYIRALLDPGHLPSLQADPALRRRLRAEIERDGPDEVHRRLTVLDPASAGRVDPRNVPRLVRALEINLLTGAPVPSGKGEASIPALYIGLNMARNRLHAVADARVRSQVESGLVEETRLLLDMGYPEDAPGLAGFGYRQMIGHILGNRSLDDAIREYEIATHQYIRRQMTWFRRVPSIRWIDATADARAAAHALIRDGD
ncbi:MAG TPA: tRNA (adenosine(37)-N6)-dimethylallyltransferase MiaA [Chloroflexota bacterium]|nr:tRNA (adenosine(37)-N6)-dimethylallyltransferase MiaA [Chloroflexota bacterium]